MQRNPAIAAAMDRVSQEVQEIVMRALADVGSGAQAHLPVACAAAAAAIGILGAVLEKMGGEPTSAKPEKDCVLLAGLLAARMGIDSESAIPQAYKDLERLTTTIN